MFDMVVYISTPFLLESQESKNNALKRLNEFLGKFYRVNDRWAAVNVLYSIYGNQSIEDKVTYQDLYGASNILIRSCEMHITLITPGWEYSDVVMSERYLANKLNKVCIEAEAV